MKTKVFLKVLVILLAVIYTAYNATVIASASTVNDMIGISVIYCVFILPVFWALWQLTTIIK